MAVGASIAAEEPDRPSSISPGISPALDSLVLRCLEKAPDARFPSVAALLEALTEVASLDSSVQDGTKWSVAPQRTPAMQESSVRPVVHSPRARESEDSLAGSAMGIARTSRRRRAMVLFVVGLLGWVPSLILGTQWVLRRVAESRGPQPVKLDPTTWYKAGGNPGFYTWEKDDRVLDDGAPTMRLRHNEGASAGPNEWSEAGGYRQYRQVVDFRRRRIRLKADVKTESATTGASLWLRVDDRLDAAGMVALCNMMDPVDQRLKGTNDFRTLACVLDVPEDTIGLGYGLILTGPGTAWIGTPTLEAVSQEVPVSPHLPAE
jgi:hypothetical protein